ncbi:MAG: hypothetical protein FWF56_00890 [Firmicutes bacterium]|nr:hypothetical protein [Bacillota bacterium]MCL1953628.1 hypothetical protein [Bacillota bacterium]
MKYKKYQIISLLCCIIFLIAQPIVRANMELSFVHPISIILFTLTIMSFVIFMWFTTQRKYPDRFSQKQVIVGVLSTVMTCAIVAIVLIVVWQYIL